ncbi:MAG: hypothetical protein COZ80_04450 [Ignavibacteria bacterium CG_4_8_14_3_um_filter_37_9]|nr:hypothetical protein [Ignavibacteria bacterium]OIO15755.1 MAG: hypothetical protein AUJ54_12450 [Ignavibacteria bacterium CG1_02_37_35]PIS43687.1 MAG: hypothetical protein COT22_14505 [Ignavibacteria bacterium CG08_land_8_20_14_0_20_37_9]PIW99620.1 MAG: hypothetical protein COZ80_04450 [Ignavibacteria bacterium CG_4_8_14_3_um_filter_37_9]PIX94686.1 MAG: hypothetical protein COZ25_04230 [Ignavibacteria bacterium CG_4_10_14_3_um_filter_37_18]
MAKSVKKKGSTKVSKVLTSPFSIYWSRINYLILALGIILSVLGYYFLSIKPWNSTSALYLGPVILILVYLVFFPLSILFRKKESSPGQEPK